MNPQANDEHELASPKRTRVWGTQSTSSPNPTPSTTTVPSAGTLQLGADLGMCLCSAWPVSNTLEGDPQEVARGRQPAPRFPLKLVVGIACNFCELEGPGSRQSPLPGCAKRPLPSAVCRKEEAGVPEPRSAGRSWAPVSETGFDILVDRLPPPTSAQRLETRAGVPTSTTGGSGARENRA